MARFGPVITAMVTPFDDHGHVDLDGAATLARWLLDAGSDALVLTGTTGEVSCLTDDEQIDVWRAVRAATDAPLLAGTGMNDTNHAIELTAAAGPAGMDGVLVVTPYYIRPSQTGIETHFRAVAAATELPMVLYDIPVRTGRRISAEVIGRLATEVTNIVGLKDAAGDVAATAQLICELPDDFEVYCGEDSLTLPLAAIGAVGVISVCTHWAAPQMGDLFAAVDAGDLDRARRANAALVDSYVFEGTDAAPNPVPTKAMLRALGLPAGHCRPPHGPPPEGLEAEALRIYEALGNPRP